MEYIMGFLIGATPEETVLRFFVFALVLSGVFDWISALLGGVRP